MAGFPARVLPAEPAGHRRPKRPERETWTCCSSRPVAARPRLTSGWRLSRWSCGGCATRDRSLRAGVSVLMRYTLRLLTLDQFGRAASAGLRPRARARQGRDAARRVAVRDRPVGRQGRDAERDGTQGRPRARRSRAPRRSSIRTTRATSHRRFPSRTVPGAASHSSPNSFRSSPTPTIPTGSAHRLRELRVRLRSATGHCRSSPSTSRCTVACPRFSSRRWTSSRRCRGSDTSGMLSGRSRPRDAAGF